MRIAFLAAAALAGCAGASPDPAWRSARIISVVCYEIAGERPAVVAPNAYAATRPKSVKEFVVVMRTDRPGLAGYGVGPSQAPPEIAGKLVGRSPVDLFEGDPELAVRLRGMDLAVLDLVGKIRGCPVAELWGPVRRSSVEGYDSSLYMEDLLAGAELDGYPYAADPPVERVARKAKEAVERRGFRTLKIKVGRSGRLKGDPAGVAADVEAVRAVRRAVGPSVRIFVDGNNGYRGHPEWVMEFARGVKDAGVFAMEEMFPEDVEGYTRLREQLRAEGISMRIAEGESLGDFSPAWERDYLKSGLVDIAQPDLCRFGILGIRRWAQTAAKHGKRLVCHNFGTKMGVYGSIHAALSLSNSDLVESDDSEFPALEPVGFVWKDGRYAINGTPGLGVRISEEALAAAKIRWKAE